jgi:signal transduction histidine kinase/DNA-binding response OmpR family regulator/HAMP domain-containing protein
MRRLSLARSLRLALLGVTLALTAVAGIGVASLYNTRQHYEERLANAYSLEASAARLLAAGVVEEAVLRSARTPDANTADRAQQAFQVVAAEARRLARDDATSGQLVAAAVTQQAALRADRPAHTAALQARRSISSLVLRQSARRRDARHDATRASRRALIAVSVAGGLALLGALALAAALIGAVRRPLENLVRAANRLARGDRSARVPAGGPGELDELAQAFNAMAADLEIATERLEAERGRLETIIESLGDALVVADSEGRVVVANPRAAVLLPELAPGAPVAQAADLPQLEEALEGEVTVDRDGRTLDVTAVRLGGEDSAGVVWTVRDRTERARLERLKSEFVSTASHELRSPLTSIKGFVELLAHRSDLSGQQREYLDIIMLSTNRVVDLVNDLLDVARVEAGRMEIHRRPTDLADVVGEVTTLMGPRIAEKRQSLAVDVPADLPRALADPGRVRQILTNLLTNAHLYTPEGGQLGVSLDASAGWVVMTVSDNGEGMSAEALEQVYERFYRGRDGGGTPGSGLGLSIVKSLVELHGGAIDVESEVGVGTRFTVRLQRAPEGTGRATHLALRGKRILVVDDEPDVARLIAERLEPFGVEASVVHSGQDAIERLREERFDAITLDILMPETSGFEVLRMLRGDPRLRDLPVVVVSVFSGREALSGEWVVSKPIDADELADALGAAVLAGRVRVLVVAPRRVRDRLAAILGELGIAYDWATSAREAAKLCDAQRFEVALVDASLADPARAIAALDLRGRRLPRSVIVFSAGDDQGFVKLAAEAIPLEDAGAAVLGLLGSETAPE